jgi:hypothetical protein
MDHTRDDVALAALGSAHAAQAARTDHDAAVAVLGVDLYAGQLVAAGAEQGLQGLESDHRMGWDSVSFGAGVGIRLGWDSVALGLGLGVVRDSC